MKARSTPRRTSTHAAGLLLLLACWPCGDAAAQSLELNQYAHTSWRLGNIPDGEVTAFAQTNDGYLWLGTLNGLYRFDGVRAVQWKPPAGQKLPATFVTHLVVSRDGTLWIGTYEGLASWRDGKLTNYREMAGRSVGAIAEDSTGVIWVGLRKPGQLCAVKPNEIACRGTTELGVGVQEILADRTGNLWVLGENDLWHWAPGTPHRYPINAAPYHANAVEDNAGAIIVGSEWGLKRLEGNALKPYRLPDIAGRFTALNLFRSSDGSLWVSSPYAGLYHLHKGRTDRFTAADGLSSDYAKAFFEDREGNVWVATEGGIDQFHPVIPARVASRQGLSTHTVWSVQAMPDSSVWVATAAGLNQWRNGQVTVYADDDVTRPVPNTDKSSGILRAMPNTGVDSPVYSLGLDNTGRLWASTIHGLVYHDSSRFLPVRGSPTGYAFAVAGDSRGAVWFTQLGVGLFRWSPTDRVVRRIQVAQHDGTNSMMGLLPDAKRGGMWAGLFGVGIAYLVDGKTESTYSKPDGLGDVFVYDMRTSSDGALWAATPNGLSRVATDHHITTLSTKNGLPCDFVQWSIEDDDRALWIHTTCGLVRISPSEMDAWVRDPARHVKLDIFNRHEYEYACCPYRPAVTKAADGRIWFVDGHAASVIDPRRVPFNNLPPPVYVERVTADREIYEAGSPRRSVRLSPRVRNLAIEYTALSLTAPEKVRFRYRLEGQDPEWREVINKRQVEYSNLPPGTYHFRVTAANNDGVWNTTGASLDLVVPPAFYQVIWFRLLCAAALGALFLMLHRARVRTLERRNDERRSADEALATLRTELAHATRLSSLATLTASIAHEVNQPLTGIITNANTCQRMLAPESPNMDGAREVLRRLIRDGNRASDVVKRLRSLFARKPVVAEPVDLNDATREVVALSEAELERARVTLGLELMDKLPLVLGDRVQLQQVIINLLRNACDAMLGVDDRPHEMLISTVHAMDDDIGDCVWLSVRDSGVGFGPDGAEKLFGAFYSTKEDGMGIGLSVCRSIIESHNGRLRAVPNDGPGATFAFSIPCAE